jgi:hypothetical protein
VAPATALTAAFEVPFAQTLFGAVIVGELAVETVTVFDALPLQPEAFVTVTLYVVVVAGVAVIVCVVAPVFQRYDVNPAPASRTMLLFGQAVDGPVIDGAGAAAIGMVAVALPLQLPLPTVMPRTTLPDAAAVKVRFGVPWPPVIEPPVIVQAYVAPACAPTLAFAEAFGQTLAGAEMTGVAALLTATVALPFDEQLPLVMVTLSPMLPLAGALKVMLEVPCPLTSVPLVTVHAYVAPAVGVVTLAARFVALGQALEGAVMALGGGPQTTTAAVENREVPSPWTASVQFGSPMLVASATMESPTLTPKAAALTPVLLDAVLVFERQTLKRKVCPCPFASALKKSTRMLCVVGAELSLKSTMRSGPTILAEVMTGAGWSLFAPGVSSMPRPPLA